MVCRPSCRLPESGCALRNGDPGFLNLQNPGGTQRYQACFPAAKEGLRLLYLYDDPLSGKKYGTVSRTNHIFSLPSVFHEAEYRSRNVSLSVVHAVRVHNFDDQMHIYLKNSGPLLKITLNFRVCTIDKPSLCNVPNFPPK
jgi:hypothetical protein